MFVTLITDIKFKSVCGKYVNLRTGDKVFIDVDNNVAYANGVHFDIGCDEYTHLH